MYIKFKIYCEKSRKKNGHKAWCVSFNNKRKYFNTQREAKAFVEEKKIIENQHPELTLDQLVGLVSNDDQDLNLLLSLDNGFLQFKQRFSENGNPADFVSLLIDRYQRGNRVWRIVHGYVSIAKYLCDVKINRKRLGEYKVYDITGHMIRSEVLSKLDRQNLATKTIRNYWNIFNQIFDFALIDKQIIQHNPCLQKPDWERFGKLTAKVDKEKRVTTTNIQKLIDLMPSPRSNTNYSILDWGLMLNLAAQTGIRQGELRPLKWQDFNLERKYLIIGHSMTSKKEGFSDEYGTKKDRLLKNKNKTERKLFLSDELIYSLKEWKLKCNDTEPNDYVFVEKKGCVLHSNRFSILMNKICKNNNLPHILWHELRHYYASERVLRTGDLVETARDIGHTSTKVLQSTYAHKLESKKLEKQKLEIANSSALAQKIS